jgi:hypothetical protein
LPRRREDATAPLLAVVVAGRAGIANIVKND